MANYLLGYGIGIQDVAKWVSTLVKDENNYGDVVLKFTEAPVYRKLQDVLKDF